MVIFFAARCMHVYLHSPLFIHLLLYFNKQSTLQNTITSQQDNEA